MEHLTQKQIEDYSQRRLVAAELLLVDDHVAECEACRLWLETEINGDAAFLGLHGDTLSDESSGHLTANQTADYVDKNLPGEKLQIVTDHLAVCEQCLLAVEDLRAFRNQIAPSLDLEYQPTPAPAPTVAASWLSRAGSLFRMSPVPAFGGAALAVILLALAGWFVLRTQRGREPQIAAAPTPASQPSAATATPEAAALVAQLNDGGRVLTLDQEGKLSGADDLPPAYRNMLTKVLKTQRIERSSQLQGLARAPSSLLSSSDRKDQFSVLEPVGNVVLTSKPTFRWSMLDGAEGYVVEVYDEQFQQVASSPQLSNSSWTTTLGRGKVYSWQVKAIKERQEIASPRPPAPQAKFRVLDRAKANELARAKRAFGSSHLTLGLLYAEAGLLKEAEQELRRLRRANQNSELANKLLRQIQALRR